MMRFLIEPFTGEYHGLEVNTITFSNPEASGFLEDTTLRPLIATKKRNAITHFNFEASGFLVDATFPLRRLFDTILRRDSSA